MNSNEITYFGITNYRNTNRRFGIKDQDALRHIYCLGRSGSGKSTLLLNMAVSHIERGHGICLIDPHSSLCSDLLDRIPTKRLQDVIYFNATDTVSPIAFNPLHNVHPKYHHLVTSGLIGTFKKIWANFWGPNTEHILRYCLLTLLYYPEATLLHIPTLLTNTAAREEILSYVTEDNIIAFWKKEFEKTPASVRAKAISPILNKMGMFAACEPLRGIVGQTRRSFRMQEILDQGKVLIVNLSKGDIGEDAAALLGALIVTSIQLAALHRAKLPECRRRPFYLFADEMQSYVSLSFIDILAESRKFKLALFLSHQYLGQLDERIRDAILGNVGTIIVFRLGAVDAAYLGKEFYPTFNEEDLVNLPRYGMYLKLMIDGTASQPFSAFSLPATVVRTSSRNEIVTASKKKYGLQKSGNSQ